MSASECETVASAPLLATRGTWLLIGGWTFTYAFGSWLLEWAYGQIGTHPSMPFLAGSKNAVYALVWGPLLVLAVWLTDRWPVRSPADVGRLTLHVGAAMAAPFAWGTAAYHLCLAWVPGWAPWGVARTFLKTANGVIYVYCIVVVICHLVSRIRTNRVREVAAQRAAESATRAQLQALAMELQPHFLFNALHAVSALMYVDRSAAVAAVRGLADMLRYAVRTATTGEVTLGEELAALRRYTRIQELRFGDALSITWTVDRALYDVAVPHLLLQPLVENAIKYGVEMTSTAGRVEIDARREGAWLVIQVIDDGVGPARAAWARRRESGRGLTNVRERLIQLYGERQQLVLLARDGQGAVAQVRIPYRICGRSVAREVPDPGRRRDRARLRTLEAEL